MSEAQAGTPAVAPDDSQKAATQEAQKPEDSVTVSAQFKKEALESWKPAAEKANKLERELEVERARIKDLERLAYGGGAGQATDPNAELVAQLREQAQYDPVARAALMSIESNARTEAELWLARQLPEVSQQKREKAFALVRLSGYQMSPDQALSVVSDPDAGRMAEELGQLKQENERLKGARPSGVSPATTTPSADTGAQVESMKMSEYLTVMQQGGERARALMQAVGSNKTKLVRE